MHVSCIFCRIAHGEIPARIVYQDELVVAFHDVSPQAPVHVLVIPRLHVDSLAATTAEHAALLGHLLGTLRNVARDLGVAENGYRTVLNTGFDGGQSVSHLHAHLLAGRPGWVMTREQIVDAVRGEDYPVTDRAVDVQIVGLRKKLGARADYIETVRGVGYRFKE